ncbi:MAG TPA: DUF1343 domain-containing protein [Gemmatimonadales bacterium]|nr:DUF1343 domain-containing protein [Gemmatimonadales bacterium]
MRAHQFSVVMMSLGLAVPGSRGAAQVRPGIEVVVTDSAHLIRGKRIGLLSNQSGVDRHGVRDVDLLRGAGFQVTALFGPEHGFQGAEDRPGLADGVDSATGLPIYSLYGGSEAKARAALDSVDVVLIDLQDIGARYYTYPASATSLIREAAALGKPVVVLDRPDPVGGDLTQGNVRVRIGDPDTDFVGFLPVPMRHGMTLGELLRLATAQLGLQVRLTVVPAAGWRRGEAYDSTGLPWVRPSPNLPDLESAFHYPGLCLFEGTNLSVGRGTPFAFQVVGAPWIDPEALRRALGPAAGVAIDTVRFTPAHPTDGKFDGVALGGLRFRVTDRRTYDPTRLAVRLLVALRRLYPSRFEFRPAHFDRLAGPALRPAVERGESAAAITRRWDADLRRFRRLRAKYLLYPSIPSGPSLPSPRP